jgi:nucleoid-associated protein YgaU
MHKDLKIGLVLGLILVIFVTLRLATNPNLTPQARLQQSYDAASQSESPNLIPESDTGQTDNKSVTNEAINLSNNSTKTKTIPETKEQATIKEPTTNEQAAKIKTQRYHIILKGETLSEIAYKYYGSATKWNKILDANKSVIKDVDKLKPGTKIIIPE